MSQHNDQLQSATQVLHRIFQATKHLCAQAVPSHSDNKKIVRPLVEDKFDWYTRIRTAEYGGERTLLWYAGAARLKAEVPRIDRNDLLDDATRVVDVVEKCSEIPIAVIKPVNGCIAIRRRISFLDSRLVPVDNVDRLHVAPLALVRLSTRIYPLIISTQTGNTARLQPMYWPPISTVSASRNPI